MRASRLHARPRSAPHQPAVSPPARRYAHLTSFLQHKEHSPRNPARVSSSEPTRTVGDGTALATNCTFLAHAVHSRNTRTLTMLHMGPDASPRDLANEVLCVTVSISTTSSRRLNAGSSRAASDGSNAGPRLHARLYAAPHHPADSPPARRYAVLFNADSTLRSSQAVPHPSTNRALRNLTSEFGRDPVHWTRYGRHTQKFVHPAKLQQSPGQTGDGHPQGSTYTQQHEFGRQVTSHWHTYTAKEGLLNPTRT